MITTTMLPLFVAPFTMNRSLPISDNDLNLGRHEAQLGSRYHLGGLFLVWIALWQFVTASHGHTEESTERANVRFTLRGCQNIL